MKGWQFWDPVKKSFLTSTHAKWLDEADGGVTSTSRPIPNPSSSSSLDKILNSASTFGIDQDVKVLFESLAIEFKLDDPSVTRTVREKDDCVNHMQMLAAGLAMDLPKTYVEAITGPHGEEWKLACDKEMKMLKSMNVWEEVL